MAIKGAPMKAASLVMLLLSACAQADSDLTGVRSVLFGTADAVHYISTGSNDSLIIQTGPADANGFGGGLNLWSGNNVGISAAGDGGVSISSSSSISLDGQVGIFGESAGVYTQHGLQLLNWDSAPTCAENYRGTMYYASGATGVADQLQVCMKSASDSYSWYPVNF